MKLMSIYTVRPEHRSEAIHRFLTTNGAPPAGVKLLGRWHKSDASGGYSLFESDNPVALYEAAVMWSDVLELHSSIVLEDAEAAPVLAKIYAG